MSEEDKINYIRIALGLQKIGISNAMADQIIRTYEEILKLGGNFSINHAAEIEIAIRTKYSSTDKEE